GGEGRSLAAWLGRQARIRHCHAAKGTQVMTLPKDVQDAIRYGNECWNDESDPDEREMWQTIRAHLLSQDAKIARLQHDLSDADERSMLRSRERTEAVMRAELAESRLAASDAQLRLMHRVLACAVTVACADDGSAKDHELSKLESVLRDQGWITTATVPATPVDDYLQGAGDEA